MDNTVTLGTAILRVSAPMETMRRVVDQALLLVPSAEGSVVELLEGETLTYVCCAGNLASATGLQLGLGSSLSGLSVRTASTLRCDDAAEDPRVDRDACLKVGAVSMVCVPLRHHSGPVGALKVASSVPRAFDDDDVATLRALADFISAAITTSSELDRAAGSLLQSVTGPASPMSHDGSQRASRFVANVLSPGLAEDVEAQGRTREVLESGAFDIVYQPEVELDSGALVGVEALARFRSDPYRPPGSWFAEARRVGLGNELELAAVAKALERSHLVPSACFVAVNLGPAAIANPDSLGVLGAIDPARLVIELTEHVEVDDYPLLRRLLLTLRQRGVRLAVDDTGSGFSSFAHIVKLAPDIIKLDIDLVSGIDLDPVRRSLA
ncbi:MAG TPA: EAL domain-containing protein, partial [Acidimicrobiales bacterium]|nr:EAL domain-containing protein [Acidimicrobiales bacterium]